MALDKRTKELNKQWVSKQQQMSKDFGGWIVGGIIVFIILIVIAIVYWFINFS